MSSIYTNPLLMSGQFNMQELTVRGDVRPFFYPHDDRVS